MRDLLFIYQKRLTAFDFIMNKYESGHITLCAIVSLYNWTCTVLINSHICYCGRRSTADKANFSYKKRMYSITSVVQSIFSIQGFLRVSHS